MAGKLEDRVREIIVDQLGVNAEQVTLEASFIDDLGADSLDSVELIMAFEEEFGAAIPEEDAEKLTTVGKIIDYLKSKGYGDGEDADPVAAKAAVAASVATKVIDADPVAAKAAAAKAAKAAAAAPVVAKDDAPAQ